jgi:hypothetical protein
VKIRGGRESHTIWASTSAILLIEQRADEAEPLVH